MPPARSIRFLADVGCLAAVRQFAERARQELADRVSAGLFAVVVDELAANAAVHQTGEAKLVLAALPGGGIRVEVSDSASGVPRVVATESWDSDGHRGLRLVEALSTRWGVDRDPPGKRVWAEMAPNLLPSDPGPAAGHPLGIHVRR